MPVLILGAVSVGLFWLIHTMATGTRVKAGQIWTLGLIAPQALSQSDWQSVLDHFGKFADVMGVTPGGPSHYTVTLRFFRSTTIGKTIPSPVGKMTVHFIQQAPAG